MFEGRVSLGRGTADEHYRRFAKLGVPGFVLDDDDAPPVVPDEFEHLIVWHNDVRRRCAKGQYFEPILLSEIEAYGRRLARMGIEMTPLDEELIDRLDDIWMECVPKPDGR